MVNYRLLLLAMKAEIVKIKSETPQPKTYTWEEIKYHPGKFFQNVEESGNDAKYVAINSKIVLFILDESSFNGSKVEVASENTYQTESLYLMNEDCEKLVLTFG